MHQAVLKNRPYGFTLIETLVTLSILAIVLVLAVPTYFETIQKRRLEGAAEQLYGDLQFARGESIKRNTTIFVSFTPGEQWCYGLSDEDICDCTAANDCTVAGVPRVVRSDGFRGVSISEARFNILGSSTAFDPAYVGRAFVTGVGAVSGTVKQQSDAGILANVISLPGRIKICTCQEQAVSGYEFCENDVCRD